MSVMNPVRVAFVRVSLIIAPLVASAGVISAQMDRERYDLLRQGRELSPEAANDLEEQISADPNDMESRILLLAYYRSGRNGRSAEARQAYQQLVIWLIEKHPENSVLGTPDTYIDHIRNPKGFGEAKKKWQEKIAAQNENSKILSNAAKFFMIADKATAEELFLRAQELDPDNPELSRELGQFYRRGIRRAKDKERQHIAAKSLAQFERAMKQYNKPFYRYVHLGDAARAAFEAGQLGKAEKYANELLNMTKGDYDFARRTGNAVHFGNLVLGRLALKAGETEKAKSYLLEAGKTSGSPQLNSFGPNMVLAKELLEKGEKEVVLEYFELCSKFWKRDELEEWAALVKGDRIPDFGANLRY